MCGRAREHRNRDRFGFYDGVERCARTGNDAIYTFAERSVFESAHVAGALRSLGVANRCTRTFYRIALLYFIISSLFFPSLPSFLLLPFSRIADLSGPILNLLRLSADSARCIIRSFVHYAAISLRGMRARPRVRAYAYIYAYAHVTHVAASVDF